MIVNTFTTSKLAVVALELHGSLKQLVEKLDALHDKVPITFVNEYIAELNNAHETLKKYQHSIMS